MKTKQLVYGIVFLLVSVSLLLFSFSNDNNGINKRKNSNQNTTLSVITEENSSVKTKTTTTTIFSTTKTSTTKSTGQTTKSSDVIDEIPTKKNDTKTTTKVHVIDIDPESKALIDQRIEEIYETYGVKVLYATDATMYYNLKKIMGCEDKDLIFLWLDTIVEVLGFYPNGFFRDFNDITDISIKLLDDMGAQQGLANYSNMAHVYIAIDSTDHNSVDPKRLLHHELFHLTDIYISAKTNGKSPYDETSLIIPSDFDWSKQEENYYVTPKEYTPADNGATPVFFITKYAKWNPAEDRAETFSEYACKVDTLHRLTSEYPNIQKKLDIIDKALKQYFPSYS